ncbi:glycosyltransferase involved in cell wall biosynthesis [Lewinella aquimaris]|uniref:Glycosyltransferase involved in cell wall biosynthesis n=1 Tax=Neolewinella aquimaris TaxID=1835722 RepID=A0A840E286_9BACT|nr:glycosyltransferase family 2 protein [Neolewinella aquimaris]MBB4079210.1 glycosyltransferase involved in cell wall biosynthesis [Neolewinella aquimaris]
MLDPLSPVLPPLKLPPIHPACRLSVTVPAKDEADFILPTLRALRWQVDECGAPLDPACYEVILLANNCRDATANLARAFARAHPDFRLHVVERHFRPEVACVGTARRMMMEAAAERLPPHGIISTTDSDTLVDRHWVAATLRAFDRGAYAVGGRITTPRCHRGAYRKIYLQDVTYRLLQARLEHMIDPQPDDPAPRHFQQYGPSMAVRVDAYRACGGMPPLKAIEDVALGWALERIDVSFVHDPAVRVTTSDRASSRVDGVAFSHALDEWGRMIAENRKPVVPGLQNCLRLYKWKVALRRAFFERRLGGSPALFSLASYLDLSPASLEERVAAAPTFGALYQDIRQQLEATHAFSDTTFEVAIQDLRKFTRSACLSPVAKHRVGSVPPGYRVRGESRQGAA